jgi:hypothetical protein
MNLTFQMSFVTGDKLPKNGPGSFFGSSVMCWWRLRILHTDLVSPLALVKNLKIDIC